MKWELEQPKDKYYVPAITLKWLLILHVALIIVVTLLTIAGWTYNH